MSKSLGQTLGGVVGAVGGFLLGGGFVGAARGFLIGSSLGGMIDPPPGPDLKGPTLEDKSFNSAAYGASLATLHGTIAHTGSIIYLENNEYKAVAKKQKTGGKGGGSKGSYETTTYYATFAVAIAEAMPGSKLRRIWAGGKLIYSVGEGVNSDTLKQSAATAGQRLWSPPGTEFPEDDVPKWAYYDGTQTEPDSRMEAVLGVGNCPSYEGTAYIIFYDFDLTDYGNGLQGCPIKVEIVADFEAENDELPFQKVFEAVNFYPANIYDEFSLDWCANVAVVRSLMPGGVTWVAHWHPTYGGSATAKVYTFNAVAKIWEIVETAVYNTNIHRYPGLTFDDSLNWQEWDPTSGNLANNYQDGDPSGWAGVGGFKITHGGRLHSGSFNWSVEPSCGATYGDGHYFIINNSNIIKLTIGGVIAVARTTNEPTGGTYYMLWYDSGLLYRTGAASGGLQIRTIVYDAQTLDIVDDFVFGSFPVGVTLGSLQVTYYGGLAVVGWSTRNGLENLTDGGELHYEEWRIKNFNARQSISLDKIVGRHMSAAGVSAGMRDLSALENDYVDGYRITDVSSARGKIAPLQIAYLFDLIEDGYTIKAVKRGGNSIATIPLSKCGARAAGESPGVLVRRDRETESQLPSRYSIAYIDYNREYDTNTQYADYPSRAVSERNQQLPILLSADSAAKLVDVLINLAWAERFSYEFSWPQEYLFLKVSDVVTAEIAEGVWAVVRISSITYTADQRLQVSARRAEPAVYQSSAVGVTVPPPSEDIKLVVAATALIMDLPAVNDATTTYGFGVAMSGGLNWQGGFLLRSIDAGQTYDSIQGFSANCTIARAVNYLGAGDYFVIDRDSKLEINIIAGDFFSITEAQMLTGQHYCAYGAEGRWEIIQYCTADVVSVSSVELRTFVRGLFGTEWAGDLHQVGDFLVLLDDSDNAFIGADAVALNSPRKFKAVTVGQDAQLAAEIDFTYRGVNLKPLSPVNIEGVLDVETWTISCDARTRMASSQWSTGIYAPIGEAAVLFDFEFYEGADFKNVYRSAAPVFEYSAANQIADFGYLPPTFTVKIYQISAVVGRGYSAEKTLIGLGDLYSSFVVLQLNCNGANGSTTFTDISSIPKTVTAYGNAQISTAQSKNGGASALFDGTGDYLSIAHHAGLALGAKFCVEFDIFIASMAGGAKIIFDKDGVSGSSYPSYQIGLNAAGKMLCYLGTGNGTGALASYTGATALPVGVGVWSHVAFCCDGAAVRIFVNGVLDCYSTTIPTRIDGGKPLLVGYSAGQPSSYYFNGGLDNIRFTNGAGRYVDDFTPPILEHQDPI